jgi:hypothetical protein
MSGKTTVITGDNVRGQKAACPPFRDSYWKSTTLLPGKYLVNVALQQLSLFFCLLLVPLPMQCQDMVPLCCVQSVEYSLSTSYLVVLAPAMFSGSRFWLHSSLDESLSLGFYCDSFKQMFPEILIKNWHLPAVPLSSLRTHFPLYNAEYQHYKAFVSLLFLSTSSTSVKIPWLWASRFFVYQKEDWHTENSQ